jgi:hypothetical protein
MIANDYTFPLQHATITCDVNVGDTPQGLERLTQNLDFWQNLSTGFRRFIPHLVIRSTTVPQNIPKSQSKYFIFNFYLIRILFRPHVVQH